MKKKLLTVLLAVVMVFGVFSLTACGSNPNPADEYNYYRSVYSSLKDEKDIRIHSMVFLQLTMMMKTPGEYLIYTGGAWDSKAQANIKAVNDLAIKYDVQVYNLDLKLDGGATTAETEAKYAKEKHGKVSDDGKQQNGAVTEVDYVDGLYLNSPSIATVSTKAANIRKALQTYLGTYESHNLVAPEGLTQKDIPEAALIGISVSGAPSATTTSVQTYKIWNEKASKVDKKGADGKVIYDANGMAEKEYKAGWISFTLSDADLQEVTASNKIGAAFNFTFADSHKVKDADGNLITGAQDVWMGDVSSTTAYAYNSSIKEGKIGTEEAVLETVIQAIATTKPSFAGNLVNGTDYGNGPYAPEAFDASNICSFDYFGDYRLHMSGDYDTATDGFLGEGSGSVYEVITYHEFLDILQNCKGDFNVFFGGAWCPNTQSIAKLTSDMAKDYGISRIFFFDPNLDGSTSVYLNGKAVSTGMNIRTGNQAISTGDNTTRFASVTKDNMTFSGLYLRLLDAIGAGGTTYFSYWNVQWKSDMLGRGNRYQLFINGETATRMCVPNIMGFSAQEGKSAELKVWKEAEYYWADTSDESTPEYKAWIEAVKAVFDQNKYASYNPIPKIELPEAGDAGSSNGTSGGSTGGSTGGSSGGDAC